MYQLFDLGYIFLVIRRYSIMFKTYQELKKFGKMTQGTKIENSFSFLLPALIIITLSYIILLQILSI